MSVDDHTLIPQAPRPSPDPPAPAAPPRRRVPWPKRLRRHRHGAPRPRIRWLRLLLVLLAFVVLAGASAVFGMLTSVASDLPTLQNTVQFHERVDSYLYDDSGQPIGVLAPPEDSVIDSWSQISPYMRDAVVAVEDKRFWSDPGVDIKGIIRAALSDLTGGQHEGGSTIEEEFVKNVLSQEDNRTVFEKLREAGLAFQLAHRWRRAKILVSYLNTIYFGNGANGVEAAARVYFGRDYGYDPADPARESKRACGDPDAEDKDRPKCASELTPAQAALLAAMVANPTEFDPVQHQAAARARRNNVVLRDMYQQHYITRRQYEVARSTPLPTQIQPPQEPAVAPYFVSWVRPLIIRALEQDGIRSYDDAEYEALYGGLRIRLTLNLKLQAAAQQVVDAEFPPGDNGPTASLIAIDNSDGEVRAMVSGDNNYNQQPFNLATLGYRQPGSAFKIFTLAAALSSGRYGPDSIIDSKPLKVTYRTPLGTGVFNVHNFGDEYLGPISLAQATAVSDNSVFTQVGMSVGTRAVKRYAERMGIRSAISTTPAMILGGLSTGVSALDMAHAYETAATGGYRIYNPVLGDVDKGPIGIHSISGCDRRCRYSSLVNRDEHDIQGDLIAKRVLTPDVAATIDELLHGPVDDPGGTGTAAAIPGVSVAGKTGTTSNYVDAWFVGWTPQMTVAVWVGYPNSGKPMLKNYDGGPVEGGTYPAIIWHNFMVQALQIMADQSAAGQHQAAPSLGLTTLTTATTETTTAVTRTTTSPHATTNGAKSGATNGAAGKGTHAAGSQPTQGTRAGAGGGGAQQVNTAATVTAPPATTGTTPATTSSSPATTTATPTTQTSTSGGAGL